jgi:hypothetical protein
MEAAIINLRDTYGVARRSRACAPWERHAEDPAPRSGVTAYFFQDDDGVGITESNKGWDNVTLSAKKLGALTKVSRDLTEDAVISVVDDLANEMAYAFAVKEDQCLLIGDGTSHLRRHAGHQLQDGGHAYISRVALATATTPWPRWTTPTSPR